MVNSTNQILNKSLSELRKKQASLFKEIENISTAIRSIESILVPDPIVSTKTKSNKSSKTYYKKFTEEEVRDAIIYITKNPPLGNQKFKTKPGWFTVKYILNQLGYNKNSNPNVRENLFKFEERGILESAPYKRGKQYRYIDPAETGAGIQFKSIENDVDRITSQPVPGTGNGNIRARDKDIEKLVNKAKSQGFIITHTGSDHIRISTPNLKQFVTCSNSTNKPRNVTILESDLKKIGVNL